MRKRYLIGLDIGGTKLSVSLGAGGAEEMTVLEKRVTPTPRSGGWQAALEAMADDCRGLLDGAGLRREDVAGIGVSCGGPLDSREGLILSPPNLPGWDRVPVTRWIEEHLGIRAFLQNDADACALAEWRFGAGKGCRNLIFLTFGTGFGAGLILNGQLYSGTNDMAGEIGHCRAPVPASYGPVGYGKAGSFEGFCSGGGIAELGRAMVLEQLEQGERVPFCPCREALAGLTAKSIGGAADGGDPLALEIYRNSGRQLGAGLALLVDLLNPEAIIIGSIYARSENLLREEAMRVLERESLARSRSVCRVLPACLGEKLGDIAALSIAYNHTV